MLVRFNVILVTCVMIDISELYIVKGQTSAKEINFGRQRFPFR
jgi:hypothetical protein